MDITVSELKQLAQGTYEIIDIRNEEEIAHGAMPGAILLQPEEILTSDKIDRSKKLVICCQRGKLSRDVADMLTEQGLDAVNLSGGYIDWLLTDIKETAAADKAKEVETSIRKKFHKKIWCQFTKAVRTYELVKPGDKIAVCISGGKDSMLMAKLFQELKLHNKFPFEVKFLVMDPGYSPANRKVIEEKIVEAPLGQKRYVYSDIGFILLGMLVEQLAGMPMEAYLQSEFYEPLGLERTGYLPLRRLAKSEVITSNNDRFLRKDTLQGFVHDEASAFFGGLAGNAVLFSTAREVARVYHMLLNGGEIDGRRYLSKETCQLFTTSVSKISRRGLGFDKPDREDSKKGNCAPDAPAEVYGHTGFTGTCAWVDPVNELVYVFLSNRIYPDVTNRKLNQLHIRERIQGAIYDAMKKK